MFFNSLTFAAFLPVVFVLYWFGARGDKKRQNIILLVASYVFYGFWDWRFLFLLAFSTFLDYYTGLRIGRAATRPAAKTWLALSVVVNLGFLAFFKYFNFFSESFCEFAASFGFETDPVLLEIILPVGISFYTFHGLSYVFDIYNKKITPTVDAIDYSVFVSFFPLLVAGPIERATHLLPQVRAPRTFSYSLAADGLRQILWGLFKKVVIADNCAQVANAVFNHSGEHSGAALAVGAIFFAIQIYGDFSGYSDIALGTAKLFGIELIRNFSYPYFSRDIAEFWRRWHISLSSWFRDYLYIPLGGSRGSHLRTVRNIMIIFIVSGFWHGANWTFIVWGALNGLYILPSVLRSSNRRNLDIVAEGRMLPSLKEVLQITLTFALTTLAWIFFRADNVSHAFQYITDLVAGIFSGPSWQTSWIFLSQHITVFFVAVLVLFFMAEWAGRHKLHPLQVVGANLRTAPRWSFYFVLVIMVMVYAGKEEQFIYFQF